ncbi:MAG: ATP-binding cassette domain-containing protein, partial [Pseudohongiellaceae bacterium]
LRVLNKELAPLSGEVHDSDYLRIGYMAQHQVDALDLQASPLKLLQRLDEKRGEQEMRNFLGGFDFRGDRIKESIHHFSGGEKSRLALALVVWQKPNLLLLDEPTNHLDLEMRHALTVALQDFNGALVVVSHDRHLLRNTVDQFLLIRDHQLEYFEGDLDDYQKLLFDKPADQPATAFSKDQQGDKKQQRQEAASRRQQLKPVQDRVRKLEKQVEEKHAQIKKMELRLADQSLYTDDKKSLLNQLLVEQGQLGNELEDLESQWLKAIDELETLDS